MAKRKPSDSEPSIENVEPLEWIRRPAKRWYLITPITADSFKLHAVKKEDGSVLWLDDNRRPVWIAQITWT